MFYEPKISFPKDEEEEYIRWVLLSQQTKAPSRPFFDTTTVEIIDQETDLGKDFDPRLREKIVLATLAIKKAYLKGFDDPFSQIDDRKDNKKKVFTLIEHIRNFLEAPYGKRLGDRIENLYSISLEEEPNSLGIRAESLREFVKYIQMNPNLNYPGIVLSWDFNIVAEWRKEANRYFGVEFFPTGRIRYSIIKPNPTDLYESDKHQGFSTIDNLHSIMESYKVLNWI